jgi:hypothetical protein
VTVRIQSGVRIESVEMELCSFGANLDDGFAAAEVNKTWSISDVKLKLANLWSARQHGYQNPR